MVLALREALEAEPASGPDFRPWGKGLPGKYR